MDACVFLLVSRPRNESQSILRTEFWQLAFFFHFAPFPVGPDEPRSVARCAGLPMPTRIDLELQDIEAGGNGTAFVVSRAQPGGNHTWHAKNGTDYGSRQAHASTYHAGNHLGGHGHVRASHQRNQSRVHPAQEYGAQLAANSVERTKDERGEGHAPLLALRREQSMRATKHWQSATNKIGSVMHMHQVVTRRAMDHALLVPGVFGEHDKDHRKVEVAIEIKGNTLADPPFPEEPECESCLCV